MADSAAKWRTHPTAGGLRAVTLLLSCAVLVGCQSFYQRALPPAGAPVSPASGMSIPAVTGIDPLAPASGLDAGALVVPPADLSADVAAQATAQLTLSPQSMVAPVGSEVVMLAGVVDANGQGVASQRIDWMLSPDSVGQFVTLGNRDSFSIFRCPSDRPRKVSNAFSIGETSSGQFSLTRGTPTPSADVVVQRGQAWITVSSATDGTSHITAFAPHVPAWDLRKQSAIIYWVDAQFSLPAPAIAAVGNRQSLTTIVTRSSDGSPLEGFLVKYEITGGPAAGFAPGSATMIEVPTDADGRATAEIFQPRTARGENNIQVEIIRPAGVASAADRRLTIGRGSTTMTWTAADVALSMTGPAAAEVGSAASYRIEVVNAGDLPLNDVVISSRIPSQLDYVSSSVTAERSGDNLEWRLPQLAAGQTQTVDVNYKILRAGSISNCASVRTAENLRAENCATTNAASPGLELIVDGPRTASVGEDVTFGIAITNRSNATLNNLIIKNSFDEGFQHATAPRSPIERDLGSLGPGQTRDDIGVTFRVTKPGRLCQTVEIFGEGLATTRETRCLIAQPGNVPLPAAVDVKKTGPRTGKVGDKLLFEVVVTNTGGSPLKDVKVVDIYERGLEPIRVSDGYIYEDDQITWRFAEIPAGETRRVKVEVRCNEVTNACTRVTVSATGDIIVADEVCVQIAAAAAPPIVDGGPLPVDPAVPDDTPMPDDGGLPPVIPPEAGGDAEQPPGGDVLSLKMSDLRDEIPVGGKVVYEVTITNLRDVADTNVILVITVPEGLTPQVVGAVAPSRPTVNGRIMRFNPVAEIRPREALVYRIPVRADQPGQFRVQAQVVSDAQRRALIATEDSSVFREGG